MNRLFLLFSFLFLVHFQSIASTPTVDGENYTKTFQKDLPNGDKLREFIKETESFENWTKLIAYRKQHVPKINNDPEHFAISMARLVKQTDPNATTSFLANNRNGDFMLTFITFVPNTDLFEFNIFRFSKAPDEKSLISVQFAYREKYTTESLEKIRSLRSSWTKEAFRINMKDIAETLDSKEVTPTVRPE